MKLEHASVGILVIAFLAGCGVADDPQGQPAQDTAISQLMRRLGVKELYFDKGIGFHLPGHSEPIPVSEEEKLAILAPVATDLERKDEQIDGAAAAAPTSCFWTGWWQIRYLWGPCFVFGSPAGECTDVAAYIQQEADTNVMYGHNGTSTAVWCGRVAFHESFYTEACPYRFDTGNCSSNGNFKLLQPRIQDAAGSHFGPQYANVGQFKWTGSPGSIANAAYNGPSFVPGDHGQSLSSFPGTVWLGSQGIWSGGGLFGVNITGSAPSTCGLQGHSCSVDLDCCSLCSNHTCT